MIEVDFDEKCRIDNRIFGTIRVEKLIEYQLDIPDIQRIKDSDKVKDITHMQLEYYKRNGHFNFIGSINIHTIRDKNYMLVVDGQHRLEAAKKLVELGHKPIITIELVSVNNITDLESNYILINKNTPLPEFPKNIDKNIPEQASIFFKNKYSNMWSKTSRARKPHLYFNYFQESLAALTDKLDIKTSKELIDIIEYKNNSLANWDFTDMNDKIKQKCNKYKLYLGLFPHYSDEAGFGYEWATDIVYEQKGGKKIKLSYSTKSKKKTIPSKIKKDSWAKYNTVQKGVAMCWCCGIESIPQSDFVGGHIISEYNGGKTTVDNIIPICNKCNQSMGPTNMDIFIADHYPNNLIRFNNRNNNNVGLTSKFFSSIF